MKNLTAVNNISATSVPARSAANSGVTNTQDAKSFGEVMSQQVADQTAQNESNSAMAIAGKLLQKNNGPTDKLAPASKNQDDINSVAQLNTDSVSNNVIALLQPSQEMLKQSTKDAQLDKATLSSKSEKEKDPLPLNGLPDPSGNMIALLQPVQESVTPIATPLPGNTNIVKADSALVKGDAALVKGDGSKPIAHDLPANISNTDIAKNVPAIGLSKGDSTSPNIQQADPNNMSISAVRLSAHSLSTEVSQSTLTMTQNVAAFHAPHLLNVAPTSTANTSNSSRQSISTALGSSGWADEFSQKISWMSSNPHEQIAELHLNPPDLGPLNIVLKISDNQATAMFTSPHSAVRDAVENAMPKLREVLSNSGITLGNTTVSDQPQRDSNAAAFTGQQSQHSGRHWTALNPVQTGLSESSIQKTNPLQRHNGMVDTFA